MPFKIWQDGQELLASDLKRVFSDPQQSIIQPTVTESTTSTAYTDLPSYGPVIFNVLLNAGQRCLVYISARQDLSASSASYMSFSVSGASALAASDDNSTDSNFFSTTQTNATASRCAVFVATNTGLHTFTAKYRVGAPGVTASFTRRMMLVKAF